MDCMNQADDNLSNKFQVVDGLHGDNSIVQMSSDSMQKLDLFKGDTIFIKGPSERQTIVICLQNNQIENGKISMNKTIRNNIRAKLGDIVQISHTGQCTYLHKIHILPLRDTFQNIQGDMTESHLIPYFKESYRPVKKGDSFTLQNGLKTVEFKIINTQPTQYGIVSPDTLLFTQGQPINRTDKQFGNESSTYGKY